VLVKDVDGVHDADPRQQPDAPLIRGITTSQLRQRALASPFDRVLFDTARLVDHFQVVNGRHPGRIEAALEGEHVGTFVRAG
jgi:molybdenum storage protein